jgi:ABC-type cobalamin transport system permease subunit
MADFIRLLTLTGDNENVSYVSLILLILGTVVNTVLLFVMLRKQGGKKVFVVLPIAGLVATALYGYYSIILKQNMDDSDVMFYSAGVAAGTTIFGSFLSFIL